jgi:hypothetical protein
MAEIDGTEWRMVKLVIWTISLFRQATERVNARTNLSGAVRGSHRNANVMTGSFLALICITVLHYYCIDELYARAAHNPEY